VELVELPWSKRVRNRNLEAVPPTMLWKGYKSLFRLIGGGQKSLWKSSDFITSLMEINATNVKFGKCMTE
jgi:hypothetical protein